MQIHHALVSVLALGILSGCGGSGSSKSSTPAPATVNVYLGSDNIPGFTSVVVSIAKLEWSPDGSSWYPVTPSGGDGKFVPAAYDLVGLQNGNGQTSAGQIVHAAVIAPTAITQWRITWDTVSNPSDPTLSPSSVVDSSGNKGVLTMPVTTVLPGKVTLTTGSAYNVELMVTGAGSVQNTGVTTSATSKIPVFSFANATGAGFDLATTCTLTGNLNDTVGASALPLAYVEVYAESVVNGLPTIVRRSMTDASGHFVLDALPAAATASPVYYVVSQGYSPLNANSYLPQASGPISASTPTTFTQSLLFPALSATTNTINATVTPASLATQSTWAEVSQGLPTPAGQTNYVQNLIIRSANAATSLASATDTIALPGLPTPAPYTVTTQRTTTANPVVLPIVPVPQVNPSFLLTSGTPTTITFTYKATS